MNVVLITGTSKGLGLELARGYLEAGYFVVGVSRRRPAIEAKSYNHLIGDVTDDESEGRLRSRLLSLPIRKIDIVVNNAGTGSFGSSLSLVEPNEVLKQFEVHCLGALRILRGAREFLHSAKIVNVTSRLASTAQNLRGDFIGGGFSYGYRIAKCAQNMLSLCLMHDPELSGIKVISVVPGQLRTDSASSDANRTAKAGAKAVIDTVDRASASGIYHAFDDEATY